MKSPKAVKYDLDGNTTEIIRMCRGELSLCMLVCAAVWYRRWGWRTKQHHLLSTKRKGLNWKYSMRYIYLSYNSFRMPCYFLIFILVLISVIVLMSSWKDSKKFINVEILISNENLKKVQFYNRIICLVSAISFLLPTRTSTCEGRNKIHLKLIKTTSHQHSKQLWNDFVIYFCWCETRVNGKTDILGLIFKVYTISKYVVVAA